jgi:hypothetical protein
MNRILTTLLTTLLAMQLSLAGRGRRDDRGSVTTEHVLWVVGVIAIVGIVVAAVKAYVTTQTGNIK